MKRFALAIVMSLVCCIAYGQQEGLKQKEPMKPLQKSVQSETQSELKQTQSELKQVIQKDHVVVQAPLQKSVVQAPTQKSVVQADKNRSAQAEARHASHGRRARVEARRSGAFCLSGSCRRR